MDSGDIRLEDVTHFRKFLRPPKNLRKKNRSAGSSQALVGDCNPYIPQKNKQTHESIRIIIPTMVETMIQTTKHIKMPTENTATHSTCPG